METTLEALNGELGEFSPLIEGDLHDDFVSAAPVVTEGKAKNKGANKVAGKNGTNSNNSNKNRPPNTDNSKIVVPRVEELDLSMARLIYRMNGELMLLRRELVALRLAIADPERAGTETH